jgi:hypothetical protein
MRARWAALLCVTWLGCPGPHPGEPDASVPTDGGEQPDASVPPVDGGIHDGGDAGPADAGPADAGRPDASLPDASLPDAGDAGRLDAGGTDAGDGGDAGPADAGEGADGGDAGSPTVTYSVQVVDLCNNYAPIQGVQVSLLGGGASSITNAQGFFQQPVQAGGPFTAVMQLSGYQTSYLEESEVESAFTLPVQIPLACTSLYQSLASSLVNVNPNEGILLAKVYSLASTGSCTDQSGWSFQISPAGGESTVYFDVTGSPNPALTSTASFGLGVIYNIAASRVQLAAAKADAGCSNVSALEGLTGYVDLAPQVMSLGGYFIQ